MWSGFKPDHIKLAQMVNQQQNSNQDYWFKLLIILSPHHRINSDKQILKLRLQSIKRDVIIKAIPVGPLKKTNTIDFEIFGFSDFNDAYQTGLRLRTALLIASSKSLLGIDAGIDQTLDIKLAYGNRKTGHHLENDLIGLNVFQGEQEKRIYLTNLRFIGSPNLDRFFNDIQFAFEKNPKLDGKQGLALELYGLSYFEISTRAKLLTYITIIEILAKRNERKTNIQQLIAELIHKTESSSIDPNEKESLISGLKDLHKESIGRSCRALIQKYFGKEKANRFYDYYKIRSHLIHGGNYKNEKELTNATSDLSDITAELLDKILFK